jgi:hypothetical protein
MPSLDRDRRLPPGHYGRMVCKPEVEKTGLRGSWPDLYRQVGFAIVIPDISPSRKQGPRWAFRFLVLIQNRAANAVPKLRSMPAVARLADDLRIHLEHRSAYPSFQTGAVLRYCLSRMRIL